MPHLVQPPHELHEQLLEQAAKVHQYLVDTLHENDTMIGGGKYDEAAKQAGDSL